MTEKEKEIIRIVQSNIQQSRDGLEKENNKFDFKLKWYDLTNKEHINEFLKDTTAIVNTIGPTGYLVIGYNDKLDKLVDAKFKECGLRDISDLIGLINKRVDRAFDVDVHNVEFEGKSISVIEIPPSLDKPHIIRNYTKKGKDYPQRIFVRSATGTIPAGKHHLDLMYYDRKNIIPEHRVFATTPTSQYIYSKNSYAQVDFHFKIYIEDTGLRPLVISDLELEIVLKKYKNNLSTFSCEGILTHQTHYTSLKSKHIIVEPNNIRELDLGFNLLNSAASGYFKEGEIISFGKIRGKFTLSTGKILSTEIEMTSKI